MTDKRLRPILLRNDLRELTLHLKKAEGIGYAGLRNCLVYGSLVARLNPASSQLGEILVPAKYWAAVTDKAFRAWIVGGKAPPVRRDFIDSGEYERLERLENALKSGSLRELDEPLFKTIPENVLAMDLHDLVLRWHAAVREHASNAEDEEQSGVSFWDTVRWTDKDGTVHEPTAVLADDDDEPEPDDDESALEILQGIASRWDKHLAARAGEFRAYVIESDLISFYAELDRRGTACGTSGVTDGVPEKGEASSSTSSRKARTHDKEKDALLRNQIEAVLAAARNLTTAKHRNYQKLAEELVNLNKGHGLSIEAIRQILAGRYKVQKRLGIKGL